MTVNILGNKWEIVRCEQEKDENLKDIGGYTDITTHRIVVAMVHKKPGSVADVEDYMRKVTRHEIVHAFLFESGLHVNSMVYEDPWATNEEMVDWIAFQGPKIYQAWREANAL